MKRHTKHRIGECKIALIVGSNIDGSVGTDSGSWKGVAERGKIVLDYCAMRRIRDPYGHGYGGISHSRPY